MKKVINTKTRALCAISSAFLLASFTAPASQLTAGALPAAAKETPHVLVVGGSQFYISIGEGELTVSRADLTNYAREAARAVIAYYGHFPVKHIMINFVPTDDDCIGYGTSTYNDDQQTGVVTVEVGQGTTRRALRSSWTLTHELMHLAFPVVSHHERWLAEGIATYVEPIGRMRIGNLSREEVWGDLLNNLPKGLPRRGERGLHFARNFDRVYWGGALYCLLADVEIRQRTNNRLGLEDALRSIAKQGGTAASDWEARDAVNAGDKGIGLDVLTSLYTKMGQQPVYVDVPSYLRKLGVVKAVTGVRFDEKAPLAATRRAIDGIEDI